MELITLLVQVVFLILVGAIVFVGGIILVLAALTFIAEWLRGDS